MTHVSPVRLALIFLGVRMGMGVWKEGVGKEVREG